MKNAENFNSVLKKDIGDIFINYKIEENTPILLEATYKNNTLFKGERKFRYMKRDRKEYIGFELYDEEYLNFKKLSGLNSSRKEIFISLDEDQYNFIKSKIKQNELRKTFEAELKEAEETGNIITKNIGLVPCNDDNEECNFDMLTILIYPNGDIKEKRQHTW